MQRPVGQQVGMSPQGPAVHPIRDFTGREKVRRQAEISAAERDLEAEFDDLKKRFEAMVTLVQFLLAEHKAEAAHDE